jgi:dihydroorotate dehydrogenase electron transfer subunit
MKQLKAMISENKRVAEGFYKMRIESAHLAKNSNPGQFVEVKCSDGNEPLLRRPLGVHRILNGGVELLYEIVGKGTELLSKKKPGELVDRSYDPILVAGGVGVAPLLALAESMAYGVERIAYRKKRKIHVLIGACKKEHVLCSNDFRRLGAKVIIYTEDGSAGKKGLVTDGLNSLLSTIDYRLLTIYACGPTPMLKAVAKIAEEKRIPCQVSLEERMACGVGVCLGCPVKDGLQRRAGL